MEERDLDIVSFSVDDMLIYFSFWRKDGNLTPFEALPFLPIIIRLWYTFLWAIGLLNIEAKPAGAYQKPNIVKLYINNIYEHRPTFDSFVDKLIETLDHECRHHFGYIHNRAERKDWKVTKRFRR